MKMMEEQQEEEYHIDFQEKGDCIELLQVEKNIILQDIKILEEEKVELSNQLQEIHEDLKLIHHESKEFQDLIKVEKDAYRERIFQIESDILKVEKEEGKLRKMLGKVLESGEQLNSAIKHYCVKAGGLAEQGG